MQCAETYNVITDFVDCSNVSVVQEELLLHTVSTIWLNWINGKHPPDILGLHSVVVFPNRSPLLNITWNHVSACQTSNAVCSSCQSDWHNNGLFFHRLKRWPAIISRFPPLLLSRRQEESCTCHNTASPGLPQWLYNDHEEESVCLSSWKQCQSFCDYDKWTVQSSSYHKCSISTLNCWEFSHQRKVKC